MYFVDATIYASRRSPMELEQLSASGCTAVIEPLSATGINRQYPETYIDDFERLIGPEARRAAHFGLGYGVCLGILPFEAAHAPLAQAVLHALPRFLEIDNVVAVGEIGLGQGSPVEEEVYRRQVRLARQAGLPIVVQVQPADRAEQVNRALRIATDEGMPTRYILVNGVSEATALTVRRFGSWAGLTIDATTHLSIDAAIDLIAREGTDGFMLNSAAGRVLGDPLALPRAARRMAELNLPMAAIEKVTFHNAKWFFSQGRPLALGVWGGRTASTQQERVDVRIGSQAFPNAAAGYPVTASGHPTTASGLPVTTNGFPPTSNGHPTSPNGFSNANGFQDLARAR